jgi:hypothetical protein
MGLSFMNLKGLSSDGVPDPMNCARGDRSANKFSESGEGERGDELSLLTSHWGVTHDGSRRVDIVIVTDVLVPFLHEILHRGQIVKLIRHCWRCRWMVELRSNDHVRVRNRQLQIVINAVLEVPLAFTHLDQRTLQYN